MGWGGFKGCFLHEGVSLLCTKYTRAKCRGHARKGGTRTAPTANKKGGLFYVTLSRAELGQLN